MLGVVTVAADFRVATATALAIPALLAVIVRAAAFDWVMVIGGSRKVDHQT